jgi:hypothetical protein
MRNNNFLQISDRKQYWFLLVVRDFHEKRISYSYKSNFPEALVQATLTVCDRPLCKWQISISYPVFLLGGDRMIGLLLPSEIIERRMAFGAKNLPIL